MRLVELEPQFIKVKSEIEFTEVNDIKDADGIMFLCPVCFKNNGNSNIGTHMIICWRPNVPQTINPKPGRWEFLGTGYDDLELRAGSSSILLTGGCNAHFFIKNGEIL
jgi:hypothetical protein